LRVLVEPFAARLGVPVMYLPGNHDTRPAFRANLLDLEASEDNSDQVTWCEGLRVIGLDSTAVGGHYGELDDEQLVWLDAELAKPAPFGTVIAFHHPPIPGPIEAINLLGLRDPERLTAVIAARGVKMLLAGHTHHASAGVLGGVPVWVATATAYQVDVPASGTGVLRGIPGSGFTRVDVTEAGAVATHVQVLPSEHHLYDVDLELMRRAITGQASPEELAAAFAGHGSE
jgi:3',5'-cyclic AMP phosphodiesterase CpdA